MIWYEEPLFDPEEHKIPIPSPCLSSTLVRLRISKEQLRRHNVTSRGWTSELLESIPMPEIIVLSRTESFSSLEPVLLSNDFASEEGC
jgi:hypothetical protein